MNAFPSDLPSSSDELLKNLQFHLMELSLNKQNLDFLLFRLEQDMESLSKLSLKEWEQWKKDFEELKVHLNSRARFINALKLQKDIAKQRSHPHIAELSQLLDQVERHIDSKQHRYFIACFQVALINPGKDQKHHLDQILENIKLHKGENEEYFDLLHRNLSQYYASS
ncbi:MAG: hypothetical protein Tsb0015_05670 [Simkaniaceae bacterium]